MKLESQSSHESEPEAPNMSRRLGIKSLSRRIVTGASSREMGAGLRFSFRVAFEFWSMVVLDRLSATDSEAARRSSVSGEMVMERILAFIHRIM